MQLSANLRETQGASGLPAPDLVRTEQLTKYDGLELLEPPFS